MATKSATIGILSIGDMGLGIANLLIAHGYKVVTNASDRRQSLSPQSPASLLTNFSVKTPKTALVPPP